ncbi:sodium channel and clathrin linker 1 isoform X1 [Electrophorus electricus]|uniref:sodium channel and clathrin linker 1 isoform X1 n=2 Tax=Electrophorus electricus TaxID=8005 RepID=UPI0015D0A158|nr:sodium channel and clathrin linker 1 isoform X1 [Electrophorus electricus]XP_035385803.1 sodium channel and clathrin linker 1 isoform X1 [Electrophorus electricus]XP_035385804.1 sodium channel and clathrin linker 1 isoform X1 [Electrophorus electricus]
MASETEFLRDQVNRLNSALGSCQDASSAAWFKQTEYMGSDSAGPWLTDKSLMPPLIAEYDRQMKQMEDQLKLYKRQMVDVKASLEQVIRENERLHTEKRISVERELESLSVGVEGDVATDVVTISNLEEQVKCAVEEKEKALQVWQVSTQELDRLQKLYQSTVRDSQLHTAEWQHVQNQLAQAQQLSQKLQATNQNLESTNHQFLKTVAEQNGELEQLRSQLRQAKQDLRVATVKVDEMTRLMQSIQDQMQRREEDAAEAHGREQASDHRLQQLQAVLNQSENRLKAAAQEAECVRRDRARWERQVGDLQTRCAALEEEKFEAFNHVRASLQLAEEASLHRDQAQLREKQRVEELERMKEGMKQLVEEAAVRTRREVDAVRKQCNTQIDRLAEELSALQLECADKETQIERAHRERKAVEEELEKLYSEGRYGEPELRKIEALHQRCLNAERLKEEMELSLNTTHSTMKRQEMEFSEELSRCQEQVRCLQVALARAREESSSVSEERLRLQQDNQQLQKDMDTLRKECVLAQRQAKEQVSRVEQDLCVREQAVEARLRELEESSRTSSAGLKRLLLAQQKTTERYRDEARQLTHTFQNKIASLRLELNKQKQRTQELELQVEGDREKVLECEQQLAEHQEKNKRLQRRLDQAEHRASTASHQLSIMSQRRKAASLLDLETFS